MQIFKTHKDIILIFIIYTIASFFLIINTDGLYCDDWYLVNNDLDKMFKIWDPMGHGFLAYFHYYMVKLGSGVKLYRLISFISYFCCGLMLFKILSSIKVFTREAVFFITLLFLVAPLNLDKPVATLMPTAIHIAMFWIAFYLLTLYLNKCGSTLRRIIILGLFFISFNINSILVFYSVVLMYILYSSVTGNPGRTIKTYVTDFILKFPDFILLPILYWIVKNMLLFPYGAFDYHNLLHINAWFILSFPPLFVTSLFEPIDIALNTALNWWYVLVPVLLIAFITCKYTSCNYQANSRFKAYYMIFIGIVLFIIGAFPYLAVGKLPQKSPVESHWQLLLIPGFVFIVYFTISLLQFSKLGYKFSITLLWLLISSFVINNLYNDYKYNLDWFYQVAMEENFRDINEIENHTTFIIETNLQHELAYSREIMYYEHNGRLKKIFSNEKRFMIESILPLDGRINEIRRVHRRNNYSNGTEWVYQDPVFLRVSLNSKCKVTGILISKLFYYNLVNQTKFRQLAKELVKVDVVEFLPYQPQNEPIDWIAWFVEELKWYRDLVISKSGSARKFQTEP